MLVLNNRSVYVEAVNICHQTTKKKTATRTSVWTTSMTRTVRCCHTMIHFDRLPAISTMVATQTSAGVLTVSLMTSKDAIGRLFYGDLP